jgi:alpha-tubulin suppressor-like RCC1 family protein
MKFTLKQAAILPCTLFGAGGLAACGTSAASVPPTSIPPASAHSIVYRFGVVANRERIPQTELYRPTIVAGISGKIVQIATSNSDGYALTSGGGVWAWGAGDDGELGDGTRSSYETTAVQVEFPAGVKIASLPNPMPFDAALAIDSRGDAWGWGLDVSGDLCGTGQVVVRPREIPLSDVTLATGARMHSLFDSHGHVYACGSGADGVLGNGTTNSSSTPTAIVGLPGAGRVTVLTSSWEGSGALMSNGDYYDWGYNPAGQLGDGTTANSYVPVEVKLNAAVRQIFQGGSGSSNGQTITILTNGSVWAWGDNEKGQLGNGTTKNADVPVPVDVPAGVNFVYVNSGGYSCYAIDSQGRLWDWGGNDNGQLGTGSQVRIQTKPVDIGIHLSQVSSTASNVAGLERS